MRTLDGSIVGLHFSEGYAFKVGLLRKVASGKMSLNKSGRNQGVPLTYLRVSRSVNGTTLRSWVPHDKAASSVPVSVSVLGAVCTWAIQRAGAQTERSPPARWPPCLSMPPRLGSPSTSILGTLVTIAPTHPCMAAIATPLPALLLSYGHVVFEGGASRCI